MSCVCFVFILCGVCVFVFVKVREFFCWNICAVFGFGGKCVCVFSLFVLCLFRV